MEGDRFKEMVDTQVCPIIEVPTPEVPTHDINTPVTVEKPRLAVSFSKPEKVPEKAERPPIPNEAFQWVEQEYNNFKNNPLEIQKEYCHLVETKA